MSSVRMCDRCTFIFSERADGWSTFTGATQKKDKETGRVTTVSDTLDLCPDCTEAQTAPMPKMTQAQLPLGSGTDSPDTYSQPRTRQAGE
jgi:hypothetical protein